jgi:hypothetical protein
MKQYGWLNAIYLSFYSRNLYRDVAQNWGIGTFFYLFLLLTICWAVLMFRIQPAINLVAASVINDVTPQLPKIVTIKEGRVITPENRPYIVRSSDTKEIIVVIDTSGKYTNLDDLKTSFLITKDKVLYSDDNDVVKMYKIPGDFNTDIVPVTIKNVILKMINWLWIILFPVFLMGSFFYRVFQSILYAIIGKLFAVLANIKITYVEIVKLAMVSITPTIIIGSVLEWFGIWFHYSIVFFILASAYLIFAIGANKDKTNL